MLPWRQLNHAIGERNRFEIDAPNAMAAVLDGVDVDSGTAAEVGYAFARGKLIVECHGDFRLPADNEGAAVNLQAGYFILQGGGLIAASAEAVCAFLRAGLHLSSTRRLSTGWPLSPAVPKCYRMALV